MVRLRRIVAWSAGLIFGLPVALVVLGVAVILIGANITPGRHLLEKKMSDLTDNVVHLEGLSGVFPWHIQLQSLRLQDAKGVWLQLEGVELRWSPLALLHEHFRVDYLGAQRLVYARAPLSDAAPVQSVPQRAHSSGLNMAVTLKQLAIPHIEIGPGIMGQRLQFAIQGHAALTTIAPFMTGITLETIPALELGLDVRRLDDPAHAILAVGQPHGQWKADLHYDEGEKGFVTLLGGMSVLDPLVIDLSAEGGLQHLTAKAGLHAGPMQAHLDGSLDVVHLVGDLALRLTAPAMTLRPDIAWDGLELMADLHGPFRHPYGKANLDLRGLSAKGSGAGHIQLAFNGQESVDRPETPENLVMHLLGTIDGLRLPGKNPTVLAASPVTLEAVLYPLIAAQPFHGTVNHALFQLGIEGHFSPGPTGHVTLSVPDLSPWAAMGGVPLQGSTHMGADFSLPSYPSKDMTLDLDEQFSFTGGQEQVTHLIGREGRLVLHLLRDSEGILHFRKLGLEGRALQFHAQGSFDPKQDNGKGVDVSAHLVLPDLKEARSVLCGNMVIDAQVYGPLQDIALQTQLEGMLGVKGSSVRVQKGPLHLSFQLEHLPSTPKATLALDGVLDKAPLHLRTMFARDAHGLLDFALQQLVWKSLQGAGHLQLDADRKIPTGDLDIQVKHLDNFHSLVGQPVRGHMMLGIHTYPEAGSESEKLALTLDGQMHMAAYGVDGVTLKGMVQNLPDHPAADLALDVKGLKAKAITGRLKARLDGPENALALTLAGHFEHVLEAPARFELSLLANLPEKQIMLKSILAMVKGETARLLHPATLYYGDILGVDHFRLNVTPGKGPAMQLDVAGRIKPELELTASVAHLTPALVTDFVPSFQAEGQLSAQAKLQGSMAVPCGVVTLDGHELRMLNGPASSLPVASFHVNTHLNGKDAQLLAAMRAGSHFWMNIQGKVPLTLSHSLSLATKGHMDLLLANSVLGASAMGTSGTVMLDMAVHGNLERPVLSGNIALRHGSFDHYAQGVHLQNIEGDIVAEGDTLIIRHLSLGAGEGKMALMGKVGVLRPGLPVDLHFIMEKAQPVRSDMIEEVINAQIHIAGQATTRLDVEGNVTIPTASMTISNFLPVSVPQLEIIEPTKEIRVPSVHPLVIGLNVDVLSPGKFFVREHGLFAEMQGNLHVGGTNVAPEVTGSFDLRRGSFNLAGINLDFTHGQVGFNGMGVGHKLDPAINFRADRNADGVLASLLVTGYASAPKLDFISRPYKPRDEVLALLLFGASRATLSPTQLAELGAAVVQLSGGVAFDPLGVVRNSLGLDHLAISGGGSVGNGGASVEAGKYVLKGVYVGAKEGLSGGGSQAQVKVDLTKHLKLKAVVGTGGQVTGFTTPENDPGSNIGLSYGLDY